MAEHDATSEKPLDDPLEAAKRALEEAQDERNTARDKLRDTKSDLEKVRRTLSGLSGRSSPRSVPLAGKSQEAGPLRAAA